MCNIPWDDRALLWRRRASRKYRNEEDLLCTDTLRHAVRLIATLRPTDLNRFRIDLPDRTVWPFGFFGRLRLTKLIEQEHITPELPTV